MKRINIRIPDATLAALRRELDSERAFRGRRYSLNDLCVRKLGSDVASLGSNGDGTVHILRTPQIVSVTPPPPPVPRYQPPAIPPRVEEEPQPERSAKPGLTELIETQPMTLDTGYKFERVEPDPNEQAELDALAGTAEAEAEEEARGQWESEGGPDGAD